MLHEALGRLFVSAIKYRILLGAGRKFRQGDSQM